VRASWHDKSELGQEQRICASLKRLSTSTLAHAARTSPDLKHIKLVIGEILRRKLPKPELAEIVASVAREQRAIPPLVVDCLEILRVRSPATAKALAYEFLAERPHEDRDVILAVECPPVELRDVRLLARALKHPFPHLRDRSAKIVHQQPKGLMSAIREHLPTLASERPQDADYLAKKVREAEDSSAEAARKRSPVSELRMPQILERSVPAKTDTESWDDLRDARYAFLPKKDLRAQLARSRDSGEIIALIVELAERFKDSPRADRFLSKATYVISDPSLPQGIQERFSRFYFGS